MSLAFLRALDIQTEKKVATHLFGVGDDFRLFRSQMAGEFHGLYFFPLRLSYHQGKDQTET